MDFSTLHKQHSLNCIFLLCFISFIEGQMMNEFKPPRAHTLMNQIMDSAKRITQEAQSASLLNAPVNNRVSPFNRRFLFSPTIQNTITNLNNNKNTNTQESSGSGGGGGAAAAASAPVSGPSDMRSAYPYMNPWSGATEFDLRVSRPRKICFTFE